MDALALFLATALVILWSWSRFVDRISRGAALALLLLPMCLTGRALLTGRVYAPIDLPFQAEPLHSLAARFGITPVNGWLSDVYTQMIPWQQAVRDAWSAHAWPLLNPFMLCGDPLAGSFQPAPYDPFNLLGLLISLPAALTYSATIVFFIAAFSMFAFARAIGLSEEAALVGAAAWMFCAPIAFFVEWPLTHAWAYLPLLLFAVHALVHAPSLKNAIILTISLVLLILAGHPETVLHATAVAAVYGIVELAVVRKRIARTVGFACASGVIALLLTAFALMPFLEAAPQTHDYGIRNGIYKHTTWPPMPEVVTRRVASSFLPMWGGQPWHGPTTQDFDPNNWRVGAVALSLALISIAWTRRRETWVFAILAVACAWAGANALPVARILHALPLFDVTLNERLAWAAAFALSMLAAIAADAWPEARGMRVAGMFVLMAIASALLIAMRNRLMIAEVAPLAVVVLLLALRTPRRIALPIVCALILIQRAAVDGGIYPSLPRRAFYPDLPPLHSIPRSARGTFRAAAVGYTLIPNGMTMYGLEDARGYNAMTLERMYETYPLWSKPQVASFNLVEDPARPFLSFLNVRWFIGADSVTENRDAFPRAFVPRRIAFVRSALPAMLQAPEFRTRAWIEVPEKPPTDFDNPNGAARTTRVPNGLDVDVMMDGDGWLVVSEAAWKGWRTYIDGRRVQWRYANHAFIGVFVPAGTHRVMLRYLPESFTRGRAVSSITLAALILGAVIYRRKGMPPRKLGTS